MTAGASPRRLLAIYLRNHEAATEGVVRRFAVAARTHRSPSARTELDLLRAQVEEDHRAIHLLLHAVGAQPSRTQQVLVLLAERVGRLKPNGALVRRSPLTDVVELEALSLAVTAKLRLWQTLGAIAPRQPDLAVVDLDELRARATDQLQRLERLHHEAALALGGG
jgi:hypothetical protein